MINCKFITIENYSEIKAELQDLCNIVSSDQTEIWKQLDVDYVLTQCPKLKMWYDNNGLTATVIASFVVEAGESSSIHADATKMPPALIFPISGFDGTYTDLYRAKPGFEGTRTVREKTDGIKVVTSIIFEENEVDKVDTINLIDQPYIFNVTYPHRVNNPTSNTRVILTMRFAEDLWKTFA